MSSESFYAFFSLLRWQQERQNEKDNKSYVHVGLIYDFHLFLLQKT